VVGRILTLLAVVPWAWCVLVAAFDRRHRLSLDYTEPLPDGPLVSVIVPARDEQRGVRAAVASLAAQEYRLLEVIVVDDESSDATATEARAAATNRVRVLAGRPVPPGWVAGAVGLVLQIAARAASNEVCPTPRRAWPLFPAGVLTLSILSLLSSLDRLRGGVVWRGRPGPT